MASGYKVDLARKIISAVFSGISDEEFLADTAGFMERAMGAARAGVGWSKPQTQLTCPHQTTLGPCSVCGDMG